MRLYLELEDYKGEEIKFHEEILATLRNLMTEEEKRKILSGISLISSKIVERMEIAIPNIVSSKNPSFSFLASALTLNSLEQSEI